MDKEKCVEEAKEAKSFPLTMFPLKSMLGNFLLMYLMAVSMPFSVSRGRRVFGSAHVCDRRQPRFYWTLHYIRSALLSLMPSAATFQLTLGQPSEPLLADVKRKGSACLQFELGQQLFSLQKRFIISCVQERILSNNFILIFYIGNHQRLLGSFLGLWCLLGRPESWYPKVSLWEKITEIWGGWQLWPTSCLHFLFT